MYVYPDTTVSESLIKSFSNHTWYLTEELILLSLFSEQVTLEEKEKIVKKLKSFEKINEFKNRHGSGFGKPVLPEVSKDNLNLEAFMGASSWFFFTLLGIDSNFLDLPVDK